MATQMRFEWFERPSVLPRGGDQPLATITPGGRIRLNAKASQEFLPSGEYARLGYDRERNAIGISLAKEYDPKRTMRIHRVAGGREASIAAKPFFDLFGISLPEEGISNLPVSSVPMKDGSQVVVIQLSNRQ